MGHTTNAAKFNNKLKQFNNIFYLLLRMIKTQNYTDCFYDLPKILQKFAKLSILNYNIHNNTELGEIWKSIDNFPDYLISNYGKIYSKRYNSIRILKPGKKRYISITISDNNGKKLTTNLHRLVALTFLKKEMEEKQKEFPNEKLEVNHIDGDKTNCRVDNLNWQTHSENVKHAWETKLIDRSKAKTSRKIQYVDENGVKGKIFDSLNDAAKHFNIHRTSINRLMNGSKKPRYFQKRQSCGRNKKIWINFVYADFPEIENEIWKTHPVHRNYAVSTEGRVKNLQFNRLIGKKKTDYGRYNRVKIRVDDKVKSIAVHRLVVETFMSLSYYLKLNEYPDKLIVVNHKNHITKDNRLVNLEWKTQQENCVI